MIILVFGGISLSFLNKQALCQNFILSSEEFRKSFHDYTEKSPYTFSEVIESAYTYFRFKWVHLQCILHHDYTEKSVF
jgi:hypothetical protein